MKALIVGGKGQLGRGLAATAPAGVTIVSHDIDTLDITDAGAVDGVVAAEKPDLILNAAAYTAVDKAESEEPLALAINATAVAHLAQAANALAAGRAAQAVELYEQALAADPAYRAARDGLAQARGAEGASEYARVLAGGFNALRAGDLAGARRQLELAFAAEPVQGVSFLVENQKVGRVDFLTEAANTVCLALWLEGAGFGASRMIVLERLGGPHERIREGTAGAFTLGEIAAPVMVALEIAGGAGLPLSPGLPEALFAHDGQITKAPVRALTLAALAPRKGERLWDIGAGSGSVSVEWCLAGGEALAIEARPERVANIRENATRFGIMHRLGVVEGHAPAALDGLPAPDAIFIGGGADQPMLYAALAALAAGGRLVVNAVTLESEALLIAASAEHGGTLMRFDYAIAEPLGRMRGWRHSRPILQWRVVR